MPVPVTCFSLHPVHQIDQLDFLCIQERLPKMDITAIMKIEIVVKTGGEKLLNIQPTDGGPDSSYISNYGKGRQKKNIPNPNVFGSNVQVESQDQPMDVSTAEETRDEATYQQSVTDICQLFKQLSLKTGLAASEDQLPRLPKMDITALMKFEIVVKTGAYAVSLVRRVNRTRKLKPVGITMRNGCTPGKLKIVPFYHRYGKLKPSIEKLTAGSNSLHAFTRPPPPAQSQGQPMDVSTAEEIQDEPMDVSTAQLQKKLQKKEVPTQSTPSSDQQRLSQFVDDIWAQRTPTVLRGKIGPYTITNSSIKDLQTTLSDEVMDAAFHLMAEDQNLFHISSVIMTAIMTGEEHTNILQHVNIYQYKMLVGAVNERGNHWTLIIIQPQKREIVYIDPRGETEISSQRMLENWYGYLRRRQDAKIDSVPIGLWQLGKRRHSRQKDGISCGIYVLKFAEQFLHGNELTVEDDNLKDHRKEIALALLSKLDTTTQDTEVPMTVDED